MIFVRNKWKLNQEVLNLNKDLIEITHEYKYLGIDSYWHAYFEPPSKKWRIASMKALMDTLRKESVIIVTCWEFKSHLFKALVLPTFTYGTEIQGGNLKYMAATWKTLIGRFLGRAWRYIWCLTSKWTYDVSHMCPNFTPSKFGHWSDNLILLYHDNTNTIDLRSTNLGQCKK